MGYDSRMTMCVGTFVTFETIKSKWPEKARLFVTDIMCKKYVSAEYQLDQCNAMVKHAWSVLRDEGIDISVRKTNYTQYADDNEKMKKIVQRLL